MDPTEKTIKGESREKWYTQGFNAVPAFIVPSAWSGFTMKSTLGFGYSKFLFHFKNDYCEMRYLKSDMRRNWLKIQKILKVKPDYFIKMRRLYKSRFQEYLTAFSSIDRQNLASLSDRELFNMLKRCVEAQIESVGTSHLIESAGSALEAEFAKHLTEIVRDKKKFNLCFSILTTPTALSFVSREERDLLKIKKLKYGRRNAALKRHYFQYHWIRNSYVEEKKLSVEYFSRRLDKLQPASTNLAAPRRKKAKLIKKLSLNRSAVQLIKWIDTCTIWQDERKENVLRSITYLGRVLNEISRRSGLPRNYLHNLSSLEMLKLSSVREIISLKNILAKRSRGCFILAKPTSEIFFYGKNYNALGQVKKISSQSLVASSDELHATTANVGTAIGRVIVCKGLESLKKVKPGDIIVTSMTRPEFAPALKRAAAIITDEGGITCHAAIVARELGIPCVIGAKIATKLFRDGMIVEVRANHGIVKILKY